MIHSEEPLIKNLKSQLIKINNLEFLLTTFFSSVFSSFLMLMKSKNLAEIEPRDPKPDLEIRSQKITLNREFIKNIEIEK